MNRIRLLPEQVANQIAAGEVIERPASVVKELVENALDAQANRVTVEIQAGGRSLIRVIDDGVGMSRDDALLCLERHATSKIRLAEDLGSIATMGFRGEAIPSIASVSRMMLTTREREGGTEGTQVTIHGGKIIEVKAAGSAPGTSVEVRQLFFNLPARRKFLRSEETERTHIQHYLTLAALAYPEVAFCFLQENRVVWQLPPNALGDRMETRQAALKERLRALHGSETKLLPVEFCSNIEPPQEPEHASESAQLRIWGFIAEPGVSRGNRDEQHLFVNRRPVENRGLNFALLEGYHTALMKGRYPVCCLFLEIDPAAVDVNIHPAKREVKFHQEHAIRRLVAQAVRETLLSFHQAPMTPAKSASAASAREEESPANPSTQSHSLRASAANKNPIATEVAPQFSSMTSAAPTPRVSSVELHPGSIQRLAPAPSPVPETASQRAAAVVSQSPPPTSSAEIVPLLRVPLRLLGVIGRLYVVLESDRGLVLLDQHAAHERILFEQMLRRLEQGRTASQRLLLPETIELSVRDSQFLREQLATLSRLGVGLSEFGERTFLLDALPPFVKAPDARRFVLGLVDELKAAGEGVNSWRLGEHTVAKTVCRHAVKANDPLSGPELENLVQDLRQCAMPYTCPHGRPTLIEMSFRELEKKFGRTQ